MVSSIYINDKIMSRLKQKSNDTELKISDLVENYLTKCLDDSLEDNYIFTDFNSKNDDGLGSLIGIAQADYTGDVVILKKDRHGV